MNSNLNKNTFLSKYPHVYKNIKEYNIDWDNLYEIYKDFYSLKDNYENQADFIANILRTHNKIHTVKARCKNPDRLIEKLIRKTPDRKEKYGENFKFTVDNYKEEINDLIGIRAIHIFKEDWEDIHEFILNTWKVIEITANVRDGDVTERFEELDIKVQSRKSGYRSVHYLIEFYPTNQKVIAEIQVRTIFEEAYGEIDHQLRYTHKEIPKLLEANLLLFNRISGSADEMASLINLLNKNLISIEDSYENIIKEKNEEIHLLNEEIIILKEKLKEHEL
ncbi:RelA/SpoT domain-containing protein [Clostridium tarantellae]|uniref:GTP pyrophosphokinase n=1 Tax=Clostridium tarantellae TaxID=39493 RepID=A0A6I1MNA7_9CLOT|nr:RelA/SpoT domain-containing protein [Clostridium tarantellae]MPQ44243.1 GTP pyrophosphokinase [Clostridium tarantellae]